MTDEQKRPTDEAQPSEQQEEQRSDADEQEPEVEGHFRRDLREPGFRAGETERLA